MEAERNENIQTYRMFISSLIFIEVHFSGRFNWREYQKNLSGFVTWSFANAPDVIRNEMISVRVTNLELFMFIPLILHQFLRIIFFV